LLDSVKRKSALIPQENLERAKELIVEYDFGRRS